MESDAFARGVDGQSTSETGTPSNPAAIIRRYQSTATADGATAFGTVTALADPRTSTLKVYAQGTDSGTGATIKGSAEFRKEIVVRGSADRFGTPVQLRFDFKFDGLSTVIPDAAAPRSLGSVETAASWKLEDFGTLNCNEGCRPARLAEFDWDSKLYLDTAYNERTWESFWSRESNVTPYAEYEQLLNDTTSQVTRLAPFSLLVDTTVGAKLTISAWLDVFAQMTLPSSVLGNYGNTFDVDVTAITPGLEIEGEQQGLSMEIVGIPPVPEPGTWALMLAGLAGVAGLRARRR